MAARRPPIHQLIERFPDEREALSSAADRIARLSAACGCAEGAFAMTAAIVLASAYYLWPGAPPNGHRVGALWIFPFVFLAAGLGKLAGLLVARLRIFLVYRQLHTKLERR